MVFVSPFEVSTIHKPGPRFHGDIVGIFVEVYSAPNEIVNVSDLQALLFCMGDLDSAPPRTWCELHGLGVGTPPNYLSNVSDLQMMLKGNLGLTYLDSHTDNRDPADCP